MSVWERKIMSCAQQLHLLELCHSYMCQTQGCALRVVILIAELQNAKVNLQSYTGKMIPYKRSQGSGAVQEGSTWDMHSKVQRKAAKQVINSGYNREEGKCLWMCNYEPHLTKFPFAQQQKCFHLFWVVSSWSVCYLVRKEAQMNRIILYKSSMHQLLAEHCLAPHIFSP